MFNKKEEIKVECSDPFADKVKCDECKCWVDKKDAQHLSEFEIIGRMDWYYCQSHKRPYDRKIRRFSDNIYFKEVRVDEKGEPFGYIKIKDKNAKQ